MNEKIEINNFAAQRLMGGFVEPNIVGCLSILSNSSLQHVLLIWVEYVFPIIVQEVEFFTWIGMLIFGINAIKGHFEVI